MGPVSIGVEVQRNTDGDTPSIRPKKIQGRSKNLYAVVGAYFYLRSAEDVVLSWWTWSNFEHAQNKRSEDMVELERSKDAVRTQ